MYVKFDIKVFFMGIKSSYSYFLHIKQQRKKVILIWSHLTKTSSIKRLYSKGQNFSDKAINQSFNHSYLFKSIKYIPDIGWYDNHLWGELETAGGGGGPWTGQTEPILHHSYPTDHTIP